MKNFEKVERKLLEEKLKEILKHNLEILEEYDMDQGSASQDERFIEFKNTNGHNIYNPFKDVDSIAKVNPIKNYGKEKILRFIEKFMKLKKEEKTKEKIKNLSLKEQKKILSDFKEKFECETETSNINIIFEQRNTFFVRDLVKIPNSNFEISAEGSMLLGDQIKFIGQIFLEDKIIDFKIEYNFEKGWGDIKKR